MAKMRALEEELKRLLGDLAEGAPDGTRINVSPSDRNHGMVASLIPPASSNASKVAAHVVNESQVDLFVGEDSWLEFLSRRGDTREMLEGVRHICEAIVSGGMSETIWRFGKGILRSRCSIFLPNGQSVRASRRHGLVSFLLRGTPKTTRYSGF